MKLSKKLSKLEIEQKIKDTFSKKYLSKEEIKKLKKLAMSKNIKFKSLRKKFCKKCYSYFNLSNSQIRIKNKFKIIKCKNCNYINRWKIK